MAVDIMVADITAAVDIMAAADIMVTVTITVMDAISGMAFGTTTVSARAGTGLTTTTNTYGFATKSLSEALPI